MSGELIIGVDLGGTQVRAVLAHKDGSFLAQSKIPTEADQGLAHVLGRIDSVIADVIKNIEPAQIIGIGIGAPGPLDPYQGIVYEPPNLPGWSAVPLRNILEQRWKLPTFLGNDANLAGLGEYTYGAGKDYNYLVYLTVSTGVGSGVIDNGHIIMGSRGLATEIGHTSLEVNGLRCKCGNIGCLETLASGTAMRRQAIEQIQQGQVSQLTAMVKGDLAEIDATLIGEAAHNGDTLAIEIINKAGLYIGVGIVNILHSFNPEIVVLGGGVMQIGEPLLTIIRQTVKERAIEAFQENVQIVTTTLGDSIGLHGTVALVAQNLDEAAKRKLELEKI